MAFGASIRVTGELFEDRTKLWPGKPGKADSYPWRFPTEPELVLEEADWVPAEELVDELEHIRKWPREHWKLAFQGQIRAVSESDADALLGAHARGRGRAGMTEPLDANSPEPEPRGGRTRDPERPGLARRIGGAWRTLGGDQRLAAGAALGALRLPVPALVLDQPDGRAGATSRPPPCRTAASPPSAGSRPRCCSSPWPCCSSCSRAPNAAPSTSRAATAA